MLQKIRFIQKNSSNKSCSELNFVQKTRLAHAYLLQEWGKEASKIAIFGARSFAPGGDRHTGLLTFFKKFNSEQLLFEEFFDIIPIFWQRSALR